MFVVYQNRINKHIVCITEYEKVAKFLSKKFRDTHYQKVPILNANMASDMQIISDLLNQQEAKSND